MFESLVVAASWLSSFPTTCSFEGEIFYFLISDRAAVTGIDLAVALSRKQQMWFYGASEFDKRTAVLAKYVTVCRYADDDDDDECDQVMSATTIEARYMY